MKQFFILLLIAASFESCETNSVENSKKNENLGAEKKEAVHLTDTTPKVTGIGGIFFLCKSPKETKEWYSKNLGIVMDEYGSPFEFRNANRPDEPNYLRWAPFEKGDKFFEPGKKEFIINYRVQNLDGLLRKLKKSGVTILGEVQKVDYGKFVAIMDDDGNKIELWEPIDSFFTKMGGKTTK